MKLKKLLPVFLLASACIAFGQVKTKPEVSFKKTCYAVAEAFAKKNIAELNKYIDAKTGIYIVTRPGAMDALVQQKNLEEKNTFGPVYFYSDTMHVKKYVLKYGAAPKYDCGTEAWNKKGFIADSTTNYKRISNIMRFRSKYEGEKYSKEETAKINNIEKNSRKIVLTDLAENNGLVFYLSYFNGKWYLIIIDTVASDCGA